MKEKLNKYSKIITQDDSQPAAQAMLYAIGFKDEDFNKRVQEMKLDFGRPSELEQQIESKENKKRSNSEISIITRKELLKLIKNNKN